MSMVNRLRDRRKSFSVRDRTRRKRTTISAEQAGSLLDKEIQNAKDAGVPGEIVLHLSINGGNIVGAKTGFVPSDEKHIRSVNLDEIE